MKIPKEILKLISPAVSKYRNKKSSCLLKHKHDSRAEADYCNSLLADMKAGRNYGFEIQVAVDLGAGIKHVVDFVVYKQWVKGIIPYWTIPAAEIHEVKGHPTPEWKLKYKLFRERYPNVVYKIINRKEEPCPKKFLQEAKSQINRSRR